MCEKPIRMLLDEAQRYHRIWDMEAEGTFNPKIECCFSLHPNVYVVRCLVLLVLGNIVW